MAFDQLAKTYAFLKKSKIPNKEKYWKEIKFLDDIGLYSSLDQKMWLKCKKFKSDK
jgi:hypothetical protein